MPLCSPQRCGCAFESGSVHISGDTSPAALVPTLGTTTTPDAADLPITGNGVILAKVRLPNLGASFNTIVGQMSFAAGQYSWRFWFDFGGVLSYGWSTDGSSFTDVGILSAAAVAALFSNDTDFYIGVAVSVSGDTLQPLTSTDGVTWVNAGSVVNAVGMPAPFNSTQSMEIGSQHAGTAHFWAGQISWVELRTGLDPNAGSTVWRFDASDYPGGGATAYTDPRGRAWALTSASAILPPVGDATVTRLETYERVATEVTPYDTRPTTRWPGMKVYCTDNKTEYVWDGLRWSFVRRRPTSYTPTFIGFSGSLTYSAGYDITDTTCTYQGFCDFLGTPTFTSYAQVSMPIPAVNIFADIYGVPPHITGRTLGTAAFYDSSASIIYHGTCDVSVPHGGASTLRFFVGSPASYLVTAANPFTWANGDGLWWKIQYAIT